MLVGSDLTDTGLQECKHQVRHHGRRDDKSRGTNSGVMGIQVIGQHVTAHCYHVGRLRHVSGRRQRNLGLRREIIGQVSQWAHGTDCLTKTADPSINIPRQIAGLFSRLWEGTQPDQSGHVAQLILGFRRHIRAADSNDRSYVI